MNLTALQTGVETIKDIVHTLSSAHPTSSLSHHGGKLESASNQRARSGSLARSLQHPRSTHARLSLTLTPKTSLRSSLYGPEILKADTVR
jgi:hypothetical protein